MANKDGSEQFDVVIVGGAMAGATLAMALAQQAGPQGQKWRIAVVESNNPHEQAHPGFDGRAIALAEGSVARLKHIGIWPQLAGFAEPISQIRVSDKGHFGGVELAASDYDVEALGYVVELENLAAPLWQALSACDNITLFCPVVLDDLNQHNQHVSLTLSNGEQLKTRLVVGADGSGSLVRQQLGLDWFSHRYKQSALVANVRADQPTGVAYERFTQDGPVALLPMTSDRYSLVWVQSPVDAERRITLSDDSFLQELNHIFGFRAGRFYQVGKRSCYPLALGKAEQVTHHRAVLVGNAAQTLHPVAGQGFNLGLRDVDTMANQLAGVLESGGDPGAFQLLASYRDAREADRQRMCRLTDGLVKLFSNDSRSLALGRNFGLLALALMPQAKDKLATTAMGWTIT